MPLGPALIVVTLKVLVPFFGETTHQYQCDVVGLSSVSFELRYNRPNALAPHRFGDGSIDFVDHTNTHHEVEIDPRFYPLIISGSWEGPYGEYHITWQMGENFRWPAERLQVNRGGIHQYRADCRIEG